MKILAIALKDLKQSFRSTFAVVFMFVIPLLVTGMFYLMFGRQSTQPDAALPVTPARLAVVNLDLGNADLARGLALDSTSNGAESLGDLLTASLQSPAVAEVLSVTEAGSLAEAEEMLARGTVDTALVIPEDFSDAYVRGEGTSVTFRVGADAPMGGMVARAAVEHILEYFNGMRIAESTGGAFATQEYLQAMSAVQDPAALVEMQPLAVQTEAPSSPLAAVIGPIMSGMLIFFAFYTGASTAQSILRESEQGTLARLFTTATPSATVLGGKYISVGLVVLVQVTLLLIAARLIFGIHWGALPGLVMSSAGIITCAASFGIFLTSLVKTIRQSGAVYGGLLTVTGMLGMLPIFTASAGQSGGSLEIVSLLMPQGWAVRGLTMAMRGADLGLIAVNLLVLLALSAFFMGAGVWKFSRRFAA